MATNPSQSAVTSLDPRQCGLTLEIRQSEFGYGSKVIVRIDELTLRPGEKVALVGSSGCGKTTLLSAIAGASEPLRGRVELEGRSRSREWRIQNVARTLQAFPLLHWLTVRENLALACKIRRVSRLQVEEILVQLSAAHVGDSYPRNLSGGERCRASLAQAVVGHPKLLLLDEPFTGLDLLVKEDVARSMFRYASRSEIGVILVTHDIRDAATFCDRIVVLGKNPVTEIVADIASQGPSTTAAIEEALRAKS